ncbi:MAG: ABC transporter ATP-binding protein [Proteobacteria bacterium]|nr:ABC transporter ATP-binding protein [Pseudomonadota bacterium]
MSIIRMEGIVKTYQPNNVVANAGIDLELEEGKIHAIVGENGAGKTTLMKILYGEEQPDSGIIFIDNEKVNIPSPLVANRLGLGMVHQEFQLFPSLTAAQNIVLGAEPKKAGFFYDNKKADEIIKDLSIKYSLQTNPKTMIQRMTVGQKQRVEILKMLYRGARILILDEPTSVLVEQEIEALFKTMKRLADSGNTIVFITHKLREVKAVSDSVFIMKSGKMVACRDTKSVSKEDICYLMVGRRSEYSINKQPGQPGSVVLDVNNIRILEKDLKQPVLDAITFRIRKGEIFGIAGVAGNGQAELVEALFGLRKLSSGEVSINGQMILGSNPKSIRACGVAYVPAERTARGSAGQACLWENLIVSNTARFRKRLLLDMPAINLFADHKVSSYRIKAENNSMQAGTLSGGNLQKLVLSREFDGYPELLIIEEPTRGLDVKSADFVYSRVLDMRDSGCAILLISSDLNEIIALSDFIGVMYRGKITIILTNNQELSSYKIGEYMMGVRTGKVKN